MSGLRAEALATLGSGVMSALFATTRIRKLDPENYLRFHAEGTPVIFVFWHAHILPLAHGHRDQGIVTLVSEHRDGEILVRLTRRWGYNAVRGSSTRGATKALKGLIRAARSGRDLALTPDGPRGPARSFKPGALAVAQATGLPLIPLAAGTSGAWHLKSWDRSVIPLPFSTLCLAYGAPRTVPPELERPELEALAHELGTKLNALGQRADTCASS